MMDHEARAEDVRWMTATGESLSGAARRLGIGSEGVEAWCRKHGLHAELETLRSRDPQPILSASERASISQRKRWAS